jgi:hypothetical protein
VFDHYELISNNGNLRLKQIVIFGSQNIEAIQTVFEDFDTGEQIKTFSKGKKFNGSSSQVNKIDLIEGEMVEEIS